MAKRRCIGRSERALLAVAISAACACSSGPDASDQENSAGGAGAVGAGGATGTGATTAGTTGGSAASSGGTPASSGGAAGAAGSGSGGPPRPSSGCGLAFAPEDLELEERWQRAPIQVARREVDIAGVTREYLLVVPVDYDPNRAYPLVFGFHGAGGDREQLRRYMDLEVPAAGQALFLYPGGLVLPDRGSTGWELDSESDDLAFVDALLSQYTSELCVDENRVFATGHSFGGCMSNTVGCYRGEVFRAVAPVAGCGPFSRASCVGQVASMQIHSPLDTSTDYSGAISACTRYLRANSCDEQPECGCHWVDALESPEDECVQQAQASYEPTVQVEVTDRDDQDPVFRQYLNCDPDYPVVFIDHWRRERDPEDTADERWHNPPPWAPAVIWEFFDGLSVPTD